MSIVDSVLPVHPVTGETALGFTRRGPIWPLAGGSSEDDQDSQGDGTDTGEDGQGDEQDGQGDDSTGDGDDQSGQDALGDAGKKALQDMKGKWKSERDRRRQLETELEQARQTSSNDTETSAEEIRRQADRDATAQANRRIVKAEVKAAASGKLADPADAVRFLELNQFEVDESGELDSDEVAEAINDLVTTKPYLAAQGGKRFQGTADGGARKGTNRPQQLTRDDLKRMSPEDITAAKKEGRLNDLLGRDK